MKNNMIKYISALVVFLAFSSCKRQELSEVTYVTALIPVSINWDNSGINPTRTDDQNTVHRVSLRFFPKDGSAPFECYLENDIYNGEIEVPAGEYSVIAMNESVLDVYWTDFYTFSDIDDFDKMSATAVAADPSKYKFYTPSANEQFMVESHKITSWSNDNYVVTQDMINSTRIEKSKSERDEFTIDVDFRRLTHDIKIVAKVKHLKSAHTMQGAFRGLSQKMYLASAKSEASPATHFFVLNDRKFNEGSSTDGTTEKTFRSFGKLPEGSQSRYSMMVDVIFINGSHYSPVEPLEWDLTDVINPQTGIEVDILINIELPQVNDDSITIPDWDDDDDHIIVT